MAVLTIHHYIDIIDSFVNNVLSKNNTYYLYVGKPDPWLDINGNITTSPVTAISSVEQYELDLYKDIVFGKEITPGHISYMVPRYTWTANTVYDYYDYTIPDLYSKKFFVITDNLEVYKCIDNFNGALSTVKPSLNSKFGTFQTADGYTWKYMYSIDAANNMTFSTPNYIPVIVDPIVANNAVSGSIDAIRLRGGGAGYITYYSGYVVQPINDYNLVIDKSASSINDFYAESSIYLKAGFGAGQLRKIKKYDGLNKILSVYEPFDSYTTLNVANNTGTFNLGDTITQNIDDITFIYQKGAFQIGDIVLQSDTGANATVASSNSTVLKLVRVDGSSFLKDFQIGSNAYPLISQTQSPTIASGTVNIANATTIYVNSASSTSFTTDYAVGSYIQIGNTQNINTRRVITVNSSVIQVDLPFGNSFTSNVHYKVTTAAIPYSVVMSQANGYVSNTNLNGSVITYSNTSILGQSFIVGERVDLVDISNTSQSVYGTVSYANSTSLILSDISGSGFIGETANNSLTVGYSGNTGPFTVGDKITDANTIATGIISSISSEANTFILSNVSGYFGTGDALIDQTNTSVTATVYSIYSTNHYIRGSSSLQRAHIDSVDAYPNITIKSQLGNFTLGLPIFSRNSANLQVINGSANLISDFNSINPQTQYIISPSVNIEGDGNGMIAYTTVNNHIKIYYDMLDANGIFNIGDSIIDTNGGSTGIIINANSSVLYIQPTLNEFRVNDIMKNQSGTTATISGIGETTPGISSKVYYTNSSAAFYLGDTITETVTGAVGIVTEVNPLYLVIMFNNGFFKNKDYFVSNKNVHGQIKSIIISPHNIESVSVVNSGYGYTFANVYITANTLYGNGAVVSPVISPAIGHGGDVKAELGARYVGISLDFNTASNESYKYPMAGTFSKIGIIENPLFDDVVINLDANTFTRTQLGLTSVSGTFVNNEIVIQNNSTSPSGTVVYSNSTYMELQNAFIPFANGGHYSNGTVANDNIVGLYSGARANVNYANVSMFSMLSNVELISETTSGSTATITTAYSNTKLHLTNVTGKFSNNDIAYDPVTNAYANVVSIYTSNGTIDVTSIFGIKFNQSLRLPITSSTGSFDLYEMVVQGGTNARGKVIDNSTNYDLKGITSNTGAFIVGDTVVNQINSHAIITFANSSYMRLSSATGGFYNGDTITSLPHTQTATAANAFSVIVLNDVSGVDAVAGIDRFQSGTYSANIVGQTSGVQAKSVLNNTIVYPDLVRGSGNVVYLENLSPFTVNSTSRESVKIIISF